MKHISRRVVRAWQLRESARWIPPGGVQSRVMPGGTWIIESVTDGSRWAVASHLFWRKYRLIRRDTMLNGLYLNVDQLRFETPETTGLMNTEEGVQRVAADDVIAVGSLGDRWPVSSRQVGTVYRRDTPVNRLRFLFGRGRRLHLLKRASGLLLLLGSLLLAIRAVETILSGNSNPISWDTRMVIRGLSLLVLLTPVIGWFGIRLLMPTLLPPSFLSALLCTGAWLMIGWSILAMGTGVDLYDSILESIRLFTKSNLPEALTGQQRIFARTAELVAATITFLTLVAVSRTLVRRSWDNLITRLRSYDVIIWGLGDTGMRLIEDLRSDLTLYDTTQRVVVVERDSANPNIRRAQDLGVPVLIDRGNTIQLLRRLATSPVRSRWTATRVLALTNDISTNISVAEAVDTRKARHKAVSVMIRLDSLWSQERMREREVISDQPMHLLTINAHSSCAEEVMTHMRIFRTSDLITQPIVIIGLSQLSIALLDSLRREVVLHQAKLKAVTKLRQRVSQVSTSRLTVFWVTEPGSIHIANMLLPADIVLNNDTEAESIALRVHVLETVDPFDCELNELLPEGECPRIVVLCGPNAPTATGRFMSPKSDANTADGKRVHWALFVEADGGDHLMADASYPVREHTPEGPIQLFPSDGLKWPKRYFDGEIGVIARAVHEFFRATKDRSQDQGPDPANQAWSSPWLATDKRKDTFLWVRNALTWLHEDYQMVVRPVGAGRVPSTPKRWQSIAEGLARREHDDWCERNDKNYQWSALGQREQERNRLPFVHFPDLLSACRLELRSTVTCGPETI